MDSEIFGLVFAILFAIAIILGITNTIIYNQYLWGCKQLQRRFAIVDLQCFVGDFLYQSGFARIDYDPSLSWKLCDNFLQIKWSSQDGEGVVNLPIGHSNYKDNREFFEENPEGFYNFSRG